MRIESEQPKLSHSLLSGAVAQSAEILTLGHIFERIKIEQQSKPELRGMRQTVQHMWTKGGMHEIYKGTMWNAVSGISKGVGRWGGYSGFYKLYGKALPEEWQKKYPAAVSLAVGISSGFVVTTCVACPLENLKIQRMTGNNARQKGLGFFFRGWHRTIVKQSFSLSSYLIAFEKFKQIAETHNRQGPMPLYQKMLISASAGMVSCLFHTPLDMMKTQAQKENPLTEKKFFAAARFLFEKYGARGFYSSLNVKLLRSGWHAGVTLGIMDRLNALPEQMKLK